MWDMGSVHNMKMLLDSFFYCACLFICLFVQKRVYICAFGGIEFLVCFCCRNDFAGILVDILNGLSRVKHFICIKDQICDVIDSTAVNRP